MKSLFRSKNRRDSFPKTHSSRSSSVTSCGDSGIDDDSNRSGSSASTMSNRSGQMMGESRTISAGNEQSSNPFTATVRSNFHIEHLASFPLSPGDKVISAKERLQKAKELITKGEPWTKEMELSVTDNELVLLDTETQELIERYPLSHIDSVQDVNDDPMLKSVLVFSTIQTPEKYAAVHLFQCDKVPANVIAPEVNKLISKPRESPKVNGQVHGVPVLPPPPAAPAPSPPKGVAAFQAAVAAKKEIPVPRPSQSPTKIIQGERYGEHSSPDLMEAYINRDVHILNHCIDDIEELVYRVKQVAESWKQLETKYKGKKSKSRKQEADAIEARSPLREEFIDAFQKCKYSFIILGKLRSHIQNPSAPELVHYLIMPLSLLVRCTRGPEEAGKVVNPLMTSESIELLRSSLTAKETELWQSLGPAWTLSRSSPHWSNRPVTVYEPKFRSGWVPPEIVGSGRSVPPDIGAAVAASAAASAAAREVERVKKDSKEEARTNPVVLNAASKFKNGSDSSKSPPGSPSKDSIFKRVKAEYSFNGKNPKELSVSQGDELMILDDSRQWWCVRNSNGSVGFVPNTIFKKSASLGSSNHSQISSRSAPSAVTTSSMPVPNGLRRHDSSSSESSLHVVYPSYSSSSEVLISKLNSSNGSNGDNSFHNMIQSRATTLKKVEDSTDGKPQAKRLSSTDLLTDELKNKISSKVLLSPTSVRPVTQESAIIILRKGSTPSDVQHWMESKNFSTEAMDAVKHYSAEQLGDMTKIDISQLVGDREGKKLYTQLTIEKSGDCWHKIVVHRGVSELQAVMNRRKNISDSDLGANSELSSRGIKSAVRAAQSDRHDTWFEKKLTRRPSLENFQDYNDYSESRKMTQEHMTRQTSYELRRKPPVDIPTSPTKPKPPPPAPKPRNSSLSAPIPPPPPEYTAAIPAPVLIPSSPGNQKVDDLLREHERQQQLLKEQQRQLTELRAQQQQKEQIHHYEQNRIRLEQQVKDQEAMLKLLQQQQQQPHPTQLQSPQMPLHPGMAPQGAYVSYLPYQMPGGIQALPVQGIPGTQPIYTIPQVYGAIPPPVGFQPK